MYMYRDKIYIIQTYSIPVCEDCTVRTKTKGFPESGSSFDLKHGTDASGQRPSPERQSVAMGPADFRVGPTKFPKMLDTYCECWKLSGLFWALAHSK